MAQNWNWEALREREKQAREKAIKQWPWASARIINALVNEDIQTDEQMKAAWVNGRFKNTTNLGKKSLKEIQQAMGFPDVCACCGSILPS